MQLSLKNKKILVTGASQGIGYAIAKALGESGATLALQYNQNKAGLDSLLKKLDQDAHVFQADFSDPAQVIQLYDKVILELGSLDVLVNNAGIAIETPDDIDDQKWIESFNKTININLLSTSILCKKAIGDFKKQEGGIIINISSRAAFRGDTPEYMAYAASKGGMMSLTRSIARMYGQFGITAFDIAPGFVRTAMAQQFIDEMGENFVTSGLALNRLTEPTDIAPIIVFLACGYAEHATGTTIHVNAASYVH